MGAARRLRRRGDDAGPGTALLRGIQKQAAPERRGLVDIALVLIMHEGMLWTCGVRELRWDDLRVSNGRVWMMKPRRMPISDQTVAALKQIVPDGYRGDDCVFPLSGRTISRRIQLAVQAAGYSGDFGAGSPRLGMLQELMSRFNVPQDLHSRDDLAVALALAAVA